jgi:hypothetical protein
MNYFAELKNTFAVKDPIIEYQGNMNQEVILKILNDLEKTMDGIGEKLKITRKAFNIITECLQNIVRYSEETNSKDEEPGFVFDRQNDAYLIGCGNLINEVQKNKLEGRLEELNVLDWYGIQEAYKQVIKHNLRDRDRQSESDKERNSAGLGFIEMIRKSEQKLKYNFKASAKGHYYFMLGIIISKQS